MTAAGGSFDMRMRQLAPFLLILGMAAEPVAADGPAPSCAERVAALVQSKYDAIRDLSAEFEQVTQSVMGGPGAETRASGRVVFAKPGKMRWSYELPQPSEVVSDGKTLWLYDPVAREVQTLSVQQGYLAGAGLQFLLGEGELAAEFDVKALECDPETSDSALLQLLPKQPASYEKLSLRARFATGEVVETTVGDLFGNRTRISFENLKLNQDPPPETFRFEVPPGVEVIDLVQPR